jgi:hypothetical protein
VNDDVHAVGVSGILTSLIWKGAENGPGALDNKFYRKESVAKEIRSSSPSSPVPYAQIVRSDASQPCPLRVEAVGVCRQGEDASVCLKCVTRLRLQGLRVEAHGILAREVQPRLAGGA